VAFLKDPDKHAEDHRERQKVHDHCFYRQEKISFELFGQMMGVVEDPEVVFEFAIATTAELLGMRPRGVAATRS
jgi:hypothetical protein